MCREERRSQLPVRHPLLLLWAIGGVSLLLGQASWRLGRLAIEPWRRGTLSPWQIVLFLAWLGFQLYAEGYKGFQRSFCPRVVSRAFHLASDPHPPRLHVWLAPFFALALFHASKRQLRRSWGLVLGISLLVLLVRRLQQPWRGLVDGGVVAGLLWGLFALWGQTLRAWRHGPPDPVGLPAGSSPSAGE